MGAASRANERGLAMNGKALVERVIVPMVEEGGWGRVGGRINTTRYRDAGSWENGAS